METKFLARVAELTNMNVNELAAMPYRQVINSVVLPQILYPTGQDTRGWRIGENYMNLMAEFGTKCWLRDHFTGEIFMKPTASKSCPKPTGNTPRWATSRA